MLESILFKLKKHFDSGKTKGMLSPTEEPEPLDEVQQSPRQKMPKKDVYGCFIFLLYPFELSKLRDRIAEQERLKVTEHTTFIDLYNDKMMDTARQSDMLLLSSGAGVFDIDSFLKEIDISTKVVIIVSSYGADTYTEWIKSRTDYHMPKEHLYVTDNFTEFMNGMLKELDG